jgi:hypothetical protein
MNIRYDLYREHGSPNACVCVCNHCLFILPFAVAYSFSASGSKAVQMGAGGIYIGLMENFRMESFRINFLAKPESFRMESFRKNISENIFSKTGIFQNGIIQKESFRKYF